MKTSKNDRPVWIFSVHNRTCGIDGIRSIEVKFMLSAQSDAASDVGHAVRDGRSEETVGYYRQRAETLRRETGGLEYYHAGYGGEFTITWQANLPAPDAYASTVGFWYGATVTDCKLHQQAVAALARLTKTHGTDATPADVIATLKAREVVYLSVDGFSDYVSGERGLLELALSEVAA